MIKRDLASRRRFGKVKQDEADDECVKMLELNPRGFLGSFWSRLEEHQVTLRVQRSGKKLCTEPETENFWSGFTAIISIVFAILLSLIVLYCLLFFFFLLYLFFSLSPIVLKAPLSGQPEFHSPFTCHSLAIHSQFSSSHRLRPATLGLPELCGSRRGPRTSSHNDPSTG